MSRSVLATTSDEGKYLRMLKIFVDLSSKKKKTSASRLGYLPVQTLDPDTLVPDSPRSDLSRAVNKHDTSKPSHALHRKKLTFSLASDKTSELDCNRLTFSLSPGRSVSRQETSERLDIASARLSEIETRCVAITGLRDTTSKENMLSSIYRNSSSIIRKLLKIVMKCIAYLRFNLEVVNF